MNEEQPNFKVTDRRLFNADGSPRDLPPEEKAESAPAVKEEPVAATTAAAGAARAESQVSTPPNDVAPEAEDELSEEDLAAARDPASFISFLMSIASNAASALGMME